MGFFSIDCEGCDHPLLSIHATVRTNRWMNDCVVIKADGTIATGSYDGYGVLDGDPAAWDEDEYEPTFSYESGATGWHKKCWELSGSPTELRRINRDSADQGWFFDNEDHMVPEPQTLTDLVAARQMAKAVAEETARLNAEATAEYEARKAAQAAVAE